MSFDDDKPTTESRREVQRQCRYYNSLQRFVNKVVNSGEFIVPPIRALFIIQSQLQYCLREAAIPLPIVRYDHTIAKLPGTPIMAAILRQVNRELLEIIEKDLDLPKKFVGKIPRLEGPDIER